MDIWSNPRPLHELGEPVKHQRVAGEHEFNSIYCQQNILGKGSFGVVKKIQQLQSKLVFAVKIINKEKAGSDMEEHIDREVTILKLVKHDHIVKLEEVYETSKQIFLVMEICSQGSLSHLLENINFFTEKDTLVIIQQLIAAIAYLHDNDIVHRDLKLQNILLCDSLEDGPSFNIKLTDFGLSYINGGVGSDFMMQQTCGTPSYMAPEVITDLGYSKQCDIWSAGVIMFTLLTGKAPFIAATEDKLFDVIKKGSFDETTDEWLSITPAGQQLIKGMLQVNPVHRYTSKEILHSHPWIKGEASVDGTVSNVIQMMVEYDIEQKKQAALTNPDCNSNVINSNDDHHKCNQSPRPGKRGSSSKSSNKRSNSSPISTTSSPRASNSARQERASPSTKTLPNYMQPTKSSMAAKNYNLKDGK